VVAWSDTLNSAGMTKVQGTLLARGGTLGGDGGKIETSGHWISTSGASGDASASKGINGKWLFDPYDVTISSATTVSFDPLSSSLWTPTGNSSNILNTSIGNLLNSGTDVTITTTTGNGSTQNGNIAVNSPIIQNLTAPSAQLSLIADQNIQINSPISLNAGGSRLALNAGGNINFSAPVKSESINMTLTNSGSSPNLVRQNSPISVKNFLISGINTDVSLTNQANNIGILAARIASLNLINADGIDLGDAYGKGLYVDTVGGISGITASGTISLSSRYSNIYIKQNISTTDTSNSAIKLNAGEALAPGPSIGADNLINPFGPNVVLTAGNITVGGQGRATIYTGSSKGSGASLASYIGLGSGRFRYNSNESIKTTMISRTLTQASLPFIGKIQY